jgi:hypothetical protein
MKEIKFNTSLLTKLLKSLIKTALINFGSAVYILTFSFNSMPANILCSLTIFINVLVNPFEMIPINRIISIILCLLIWPGKLIFFSICFRLLYCIKLKLSLFN